MVIQHPTIADIQTTELIYHDSNYVEACYRFCEERKIDCLPDICNSRVFYRRNDDHYLCTFRLGHQTSRNVRKSEAGTR